jgi:rhodanese-related sulfurtransferase
LAKTGFDSLIAKDQQEFKIGELTLTVLHTPGHTMESTTYLLSDVSKKDIAIFSGDTLFLGDVGRPDLAQKAADMTQEDLAGILYDSLRKKIMPLADDLLVYPAHGAGSACGKNLSKETVGTLGEQKRTNYALRADMTKAEFIKEVTDGLLPPPQYFPLNVKMNKEGYEDIESVIESGTRPLSPEAFEIAANETGAIVLDVRHQDDFAKGHIPQSIFIGIDGGFAPWVGAMIGNVDQAILLVTPEGREEETVTRLARVGFDNTLGYLKGGINSWKKAAKTLDTVEGIEVANFKPLAEKEQLNIFDVRKPGEYLSEHLIDANNTPLDFLNNHMSEFPTEGHFYLHCAGGYRSMIAASILKSRGIHNLIDVRGGFAAIKKGEMKVSDYVCPSTL